MRASLTSREDLLMKNLFDVFASQYFCVSKIPAVVHKSKIIGRYMFPCPVQSCQLTVLWIFLRYVSPMQSFT